MARDEESSATQDGFYPPTIWSTILSAKEGDEASRLAALGRLLVRYRPPVLREIQWRRGCSSEQAEELAQEFFVSKCLRESFLSNVSSGKGLFRAFLRRCIKNFLEEKRRQGETLRRGDGAEHVSLQETDADGRQLYDPPGSHASPEELIDRAWAERLFEISLERLQDECVRALRGQLFDALKPRLANDAKAEGIKDAACALNMTEGAVKVAMHRMRQRLGEIIAEEVKATTGTHEDWRAELRHLAALMRS